MVSGIKIILSFGQQPMLNILLGNIAMKTTRRENVLLCFRPLLLSPILSAWEVP